MAQNNLVVVGIDVAKDKVDACIRPSSARQPFPNSSIGQRQLAALLRRHKVGKAVMEASGGYERHWAKVLRQLGVEVRIGDPKRGGSFGRGGGGRGKKEKERRVSRRVRGGRYVAG